MNKISDRRKLHTIFNQEQDPGLLRMSTAGYVNNTPPSADQFRKIISELEKSLKEERGARVEAEENLKLYQVRSMQREKQFHKILEETDKKIRSYVKQNQATSVVKEIKKSYEQILKNFEYTNEATNMLIENKYKQNMAAMERRIETIFVTMNEELSKTKMMSNESVNEIRREIQQALHLVKSIDAENVGLKLAIKKEVHKSKLLEEERKLLLDEVVHKKFLVARLVDDNKVLKKKLEQPIVAKVTRPHHSADKYREIQSGQQTSQAKKLKTLSNTYNQFETKDTFAHRSKEASFFGNHTGTIQTPARDTIQRNNNLSKSRFSAASSDLSVKNQKTNGFNHKSKLFSNNFVQSNKASAPAHINYKKMQRKYTKKSVASKSRILNDDENQLMVTMAKNQTLNTESCFQSPEKAQNQRAIDHLKKCLQRQKRRASQLSRVVTKIQNRNQEVNEAIFSMITMARMRYDEEGGSLDNLLKCQELLKLISDLKKRLAMCENPTLQCGWGQVQMQSLLKQADAAN